MFTFTVYRPKPETQTFTSLSSARAWRLYYAAECGHPVSTITRSAT